MNLSLWSSLPFDSSLSVKPKTSLPFDAYPLVMNLSHISEYLLRSVSQTQCSGQDHLPVSGKLEFNSENTVDDTSLTDVYENPDQRCSNMCNLNEDIQLSHYDDSHSVDQHFTRGGTPEQDSACTQLAVIFRWTGLALFEGLALIRWSSSQTNTLIENRWG
ncbi:hypothetical protein P879_02583 [Paragonimus westermani]|uniref:Uncharacterized protein n=1 Tax=Paragonimus westermani TaxID=34504 RepID=A0A8T0D4Q1_9TREM|nr:hypothetical protein P879_02583 [Paragonimus westermani]